MRTEKRCPRCERTLPVGKFYFNIARSDGLSGYCVECMRAVETISIRALRQTVVAHLGGACSRCGFDDPRALQIDHVNGGGCEERRNGKSPGRALLNRVLKDDQGTYALLCANCNWIKRAERTELVGGRVYARMIPVTAT